MKYYFDNTNETMVSTESPTKFRFIWLGEHDSIYIALGSIRVRIMRKYIPFA